MVSKKIYNSKDDKKFEEIIKRLREMRLPVMAELLLSMKDNGELLSKNIVDILDEITENEVVSRKNNTISKLKKKAKFSQPMASLNEIKYTADRKLNKELISKLSTNKYIGERKNIIVLGACGTGKSYLVNALGNHACDSLDCFDGKIVSWEIGEVPNSKLVNEMLKNAISQLKENETPILHTDRGCHYRWKEWINLLKEAKISRSMSKKGCSPDNSACEGFFGRIKNEMFYSREWSNVSLENFKIILNDYLMWYNSKRIKISLGFKSPEEYRQSLGLI